MIDVKVTYEISCHNYDSGCSLACCRESDANIRGNSKKPISFSVILAGRGVSLSLTTAAVKYDFQVLIPVRKNQLTRGREREDSSLVKVVIVE